MLNWEYDLEGRKTWPFTHWLLNNPPMTSKIYYASPIGVGGLKGKQFLSGCAGHYWNNVFAFIKFSTSVNAFLVLGLVYSISVISSYTLVWPYMANDCAKNVFVESLDQFRHLEVRKKVWIVFVMSLRLSDHEVLYLSSCIASSSSFFDFTRILSLFSLVFRTSKLLGV